MRNLGFVGLGRMGAGICSNLIKHGHSLIVYNRHPEKMSRFAGKARLAHDSLEVYLNSDVIFLALPNSDEVEKVVEEYINTKQEGKIIIDLSTSLPLSTKKIYQRFKELGCSFVDAPLRNGPKEAESGELVSMVGGDKEVVDSLEDLFKCYCKKYVYIGESGSGHIVKLAMNFLSLMYAVLIAQAFPMVEKLGLDSKKIYEIMNDEILGNKIFRFYAPKIIDRTYDMAFALELGLKDLTYMKKMFEEFNVPAFALDGGLDLLRTSLKDEKGQLDFSQCAATMYEFFKI